MAVVLEFRSRAAALLRDQQKVIDQTEKLKKGYKESAREANQMERAAQRLAKQLETPQERHNRKLQDLARLLQSGRINQDQMRRAVEMYNRELREAQRSGQRAFGSGALGDLRSLATGWVGVGAAIGGALSVLRQFVSERDQAAQQVQAGRRGLAQLAQLAESPEQMRTLLAEAREIFAAGGVQELGEAGGVLFSLISAGVGRRERDLFRDLTARGVIGDPAAFARSARALQSAIGVEETGGFRDLLSKAFAASAASPSTAEEILQGAAAAGPGARTLGVTDESVLAAIATLAEPTGSASEAGTKLRALFKSAERGGLRGDLQTLLAQVQQQQAGGADFAAIFGGREDQEAIDAFRILQLNAQKLQQVTADVSTAVQRDITAQKLGLPDVDPQLRVARLAEQARLRGQLVTQQTQGAATNLIDALMAERAAQRREAGGGILSELNTGIERLQIFLERLGSDDPTVLRRSFDPAEIRDPELKQAFQEFQDLQRLQLEEMRAIRHNQSGQPPVTRVEGRQE